MRIALFTETFLPKVDGIVTRLRHTVEHLQRLGDDILLFSPDGGLTEYRGARIHGVSAIPFPLYPELKLAVPRPSIGRALARFSPDLVHAVNPAVLGLAGVHYSRKFDVPLLASYHTHLPKYLPHYKLSAARGLLWMLLRQIHNRARLNLCTSTAMREELEANGIERVALWQRGVDTELFHPNAFDPRMREQLTQGHPEQPLLLYVGRLGAEKNIDRIKPILEAIPNARLALVGGGPQESGLKSLFADTPTYFAGYLEGRELAAAYASADAFVFPSETETLGLVLLEAMAAGCPVVAARAGGIPDIVSPGVNGYLFEAGEGPHAAIEATRRLLDNDEQRQQLRDAARREAERWGWDAATRQLRDYYDAVLHERSANHRGRARQRMRKESLKGGT